jgi:hypothetical protein
MLGVNACIQDHIYRRAAYTGVELSFGFQYEGFRCLANEEHPTTEKNPPSEEGGHLNLVRFGL